MFEKLLKFRKNSRHLWCSCQEYSYSLPPAWLAWTLYCCGCALRMGVAVTAVEGSIFLLSSRWYPAPSDDPCSRRERGPPALLAWGVFVVGVSIFLVEAACLHRVGVIRLSRKWKPGRNLKMSWTLNVLLYCIHGHMDGMQKPYRLQAFAYNHCLITDWLSFTSREVTP